MGSAQERAEMVVQSDCPCCEGTGYTPGGIECRCPDLVDAEARYEALEGRLRDGLTKVLQSLIGYPKMLTVQEVERIAGLLAAGQLAGSKDDPAYEAIRGAAGSLLSAFSDQPPEKP